MKDFKLRLIIATIITIVIGIISWPFYYNYATVKTDSVMMIRDKQVIQNKDSENQNRISAKSANSEYYQEYELQDSWMHWNFKSSRLYNKLEVGECFNITRMGWRVGFFSMYPNIIEIESTECTEKEE